MNYYILCFPIKKNPYAFTNFVIVKPRISLLLIQNQNNSCAVSCWWLYLVNHAIRWEKLSCKEEPSVQEMYPVVLRNYIILFTSKILFSVFSLSPSLWIGLGWTTPFMTLPRWCISVVHSAEERVGTLHARTPAAGNHGMWRGFCFCEALHCHVIEFWLYERIFPWMGKTGSWP